jgi:hydroxymethylpyrimidine pyrophosphatase-like HAD family hydrolase
MAGSPVRYRALATDYDGTIAHDGIVDDSTLRALRRVRDAGRVLLLVTGRELGDLLATFPHLDIFDRVVAENGAVLYEPLTDHHIKLATPPPAALVDALRRDGVPISVGDSIVATVEPHEHQVLAAIRDLGLEWHVIFNKGAVMALPSDVTKATGLVPAVDAVGVSLDETIGVGDAENDQAFLRSCALAVAVQNALPSVKAAADLVTAGARGQGVAELIDLWLSGRLDAVAPNKENHASAAPLGTRDT